MRTGSCEFDRGLPVRKLLADPSNLAWLPTALADVAIVESQNSEPGLMESRREEVGAGLLRDAKATRHDHAATVDARVVPGGAVAFAADESNLLAFRVHRIDLSSNRFT